MSRLTVTAKGQITLPKELLNHLGVRPGERVAVNKLPYGRIEIKGARLTGKISDVFNALKGRRRHPLLIEEINELARQGWAGRR
jgi:AbrB family looped-hinge helix DNA binding protein